MKKSFKSAILAAFAIGSLAVLVAAAGAITGVVTISGTSGITINPGGTFIVSTTGTDDIFLNSGDAIYLKPDGVDSADRIFLTAGTGGTTIQPGTDNEGLVGSASKKFSDVNSYLINGADISFGNGITMTECVNDLNQKDICFVGTKPTPDMKISIGLYDTETYQEYVDRHSSEGIFDNSMSEGEYDTRRESIFVDGKLDLTFGRTIHMTLREVKDSIERLDEIETSLCNQGISKYC